MREKENMIKVISLSFDENNEWKVKEDCGNSFRFWNYVIDRDSDVIEYYEEDDLIEICDKWFESNELDSKKLYEVSRDLFVCLVREIELKYCEYKLVDWSVEIDNNLSLVVVE